MLKFLLEIITPQRAVFTQQVDDVTVPTSRGLVGVLAHHVPLFSALTEGELKISDGGKELYLAIGGGFMEVTREKVSILVSRAFHAHELNEAEIKKAQQAAREALTRQVKGIELGNARAILHRSVLELKVARRHRSGYTPSPRIN